MENHITTLMLDIDNIIQYINNEVDEIVNSNISKYYENENNYLDSKGKRSFFDKHLLELNDEIKNLNIDFILSSSIDYSTGLVKNKGLLLQYFSNKAKEILRGDKWLEGQSYDVFKNHLIFLGEIKVLLIKLRERNYVLGEYKTKRNSKKVHETYKGLFSKPEYANVLKDILEVKGYTKKGIWCYNGAIYDLAKIYFILMKPEFNLEIIKKTTINTQLQVLYKEFDITNYKMDNLYKAKNFQIEFDNLYNDLYDKFKSMLS